MPVGYGDTFGMLHDEQTHGQHCGIGGHAVPKLICDHAAHGQAVLFGLDRFNAVGVLLSARDVFPLILPGQALPLIAVGLLAAAGCHGERGLLPLNRRHIFGLLGNVQRYAQHQPHMVVRIRKFLILRIIPAAYMQLQLRQIPSLCQRCQRDVHGIAEIILQRIAERIAEQGFAPIRGRQNRRNGRFGIAAQVRDADVHIVRAAALEKLSAQRQVVHIGIQRLPHRAGPGDHRDGCVIRAGERQDAILCYSAQRRGALHAVDDRGKRLSARPVCWNQQLGGVAVHVPGHQHVGLHLPGRRIPAGLRLDDVPVVMVQRVV